MVNKICYLYIQLILTHLKQDFVSYQDPFSSNHKFPVIFFFSGVKSLFNGNKIICSWYDNLSKVPLFIGSE